MDFIRYGGNCNDKWVVNLDEAVYVDIFFRIKQYQLTYKLFTFHFKEKKIDLSYNFIINFKKLYENKKKTRAVRIDKFKVFLRKNTGIVTIKAYTSSPIQSISITKTLYDKLQLVLSTLDVIQQNLTKWKEYDTKLYKSHPGEVFDIEQQKWTPIDPFILLIWSPIYLRLFFCKICWEVYRSEGIFLYRCLGDVDEIIFNLERDFEVDSEKLDWISEDIIDSASDVTIKKMYNIILEKHKLDFFTVNLDELYRLAKLQLKNLYNIVKEFVKIAAKNYKEYDKNPNNMVLKESMEKDLKENNLFDYTLKYIDEIDCLCC